MDGEGVFKLWCFRRKIQPWISESDVLLEMHLKLF
jgi:hypothetical protein